MATMTLFQAEKCCQLSPK